MVASLGQFLKQGEDGGSLVLIEKRILGAPAATVLFTGLDGDVDEFYYIRAHLALANVTAVLEFRPNQVASPGASEREQNAVGVITTTTIAAAWQVSPAWNPVIGAAVLEIKFWAKSGVARASAGADDRHREYWAAASTSSTRAVYHGFTTNATLPETTNITSLELFASLAKFDTGSIISLYKQK